ncbi:MAG: polyphosphate polymerase domain-containing protein [Olsenella sp.]|nr:polyphosphate polymerase domain-containing protein [Olsenella sp.]
MTSATLERTQPTATATKPAVQKVFRRSEIKYLVTDEQRAAILSAASEHMEPDAWGATTVCNVYYDTPTGLLVRRSLDKPTYKEKIRVRSYGRRTPGSPVFVELKKKYKGIVYKRRAVMDEVRAEALLAGHGDPQTQIEREIDFAVRRYEGLAPACYIAYDREAYYAIDDHEFRMTFDRNVRARWCELDLTAPAWGEQLLPPGMSIMELKCGGAVPLWMVRELERLGVSKASFSKYGNAWKARHTRAHVA